MIILARNFTENYLDNLINYMEHGTQNWAIRGTSEKLCNKKIKIMSFLIISELLVEL